MSTVDPLLLFLWRNSEVQPDKKCTVSQPLESISLMQYKLNGITVCRNVRNKNNHSFLSWKRKSQYYIPILAIVCVHFTINAEIFKMIVDRYNKYLVQVFCSNYLHISFLEQN